MKYLKLLLVAIVMIASSSLTAQMAVTTDGSSADGSAMFEVKSNSKGVLISRMTQVEIAAISNPASGLLVFNTSDEKIYVYVLADNQWKEVQYGTEVIDMPASYTIGSGGSCANTTVNGKYNKAGALDGSNTVTLDATVAITGLWSITTNTVNGYSFSGSGTFVTTGTAQQVTLNGAGTPTNAQTDNFTATANGSGGTCTFSVTVESCDSPFTDARDGQAYDIVFIGTQCWMAENLNYGTRINGSGNQTDNTTIEKYCYNDDASSECATYGGLYQWDEMMQYVTTEGTQGICPTGWHIPTDAEWMMLEESLGMCSGTGSGCSGATGYRGTDEGSKLAGNEPLWENGSLDNNANFGTSGFAGLPGGYRITDGSFHSLLNTAYFWSSNESGTSAWSRFLYYNNVKVYRGSSSKAYGYSVRCVRD